MVLCGALQRALLHIGWIGNAFLWALLRSAALCALYACALCRRIKHINKHNNNYKKDDSGTNSSNH